MKRQGILLRALFAAALCACLMIPAAAQTFPDVPETHWAYANIEEAAADGAIKGYSNGTFAPNSPLTLAHFTVILVRSFYTADYNLELSHINSPYVEWYDAAETVARDHGLLKGVSANMTEIPSGATAEITVIFKAPNRNSDQKASFDLITNDPANAVRTITMTAKVQ